MITAFAELAVEVAGHIENMTREERMQLSDSLTQEVIQLDSNDQGASFRRKILLMVALHCYEVADQ